MQTRAWESRWQRAQAERLQLNLEHQVISQSVIEVGVIGSRGTPYVVRLEKDKQVNCTCPDCAISGAFCKHLMLVLIRTFGVDAELVARSHFLTQDEYMVRALNYFMERKAKCEQALVYANEQEKKKRPIEAEDICPICCENLLQSKDATSWCYTCGKSVHASCFSMWKPQTCVFCRSIWHKRKREESSA
jgi:hypothetical protein